MLPLIKAFGEVPGGLVYICIHPKAIVHIWAQKLLRDCANKFSLSIGTSQYVIEEAYRAVSTRRTDTLCFNIIGFSETPIFVLPRELSVILQLLVKKLCVELLEELNNKQASTLSKTFKRSVCDVVAAAALCLEMLFSKHLFGELFYASYLSVNAFSISF